MAHCIAIQRRDGYLPIEDHGLIGDGKTAALVGRDGTIDWMCLPRFDSQALFCSLLDAERGGHYTVTVDDLVSAEQRYVDDTAVLVTELRGRDGTVELTDLLTLARGADLDEETVSARGELLRCVRVVHGRVRLRIAVEPRGGAEAEQSGGGWRLRPVRDGLASGIDLHLYASRPLDGPVTTLDLEQGDAIDLLLRWDGAGWRSRLVRPEELREATVKAWQQWADRVQVGGPRPSAVRRSALTLKLLDHAGSGAIMAAPTSSLPEEIGGVRNWDYRYSWVRDTGYSVYALRRIGLHTEANSFLAWVLSAVERDGQAHLMYDIDGMVVAAEQEDPGLEGYRRSAPVRWGNDAAEQIQHDVYGELLDCAYLWAETGNPIDAHLWKKLCWLADQAVEQWTQPDHGIWEVRTEGPLHTHSVAMCQVALDRAARLAADRGAEAEAARWTDEGNRVRAELLSRAWDDDRKTFTARLDDPGGGLDASLLTLPKRGVLPFGDPRMVATVDAVLDELGAGAGLLHRYDPKRLPDGLPGEEGAFVMCSFWLVDNLVGQGRLEEAADLYESLCDRANPLGLLSEEIDPSSGDFLGNFPQAFSHTGVITSGMALAYATEEAR